MTQLPNWKPRSDSAARRSSAIAIASTILEARDQVTTPHLREILKIAVWKHTECDGKYTTRYRSEAALNADSKSIHHEHVIPIRRLVDQMIASPKDVPGILESAIGCVVLRSEHRILGEVEKAHPDVDGWNRYRIAGIKVWDLMESRLIVEP